MSLNEDFKKGPAEFLATKVIVVPPGTDTACGIPGTFKFTLEAGGANLVLLNPLLVDDEDHINAYYLPWEADKATTMNLGAAAEFFFTSEMTNCRFSVLDENPKTPRVAHVAGNTLPKDRNAWEKRDGFIADDTKRVRRLSVSGSLGRKAKHLYAGDRHSSAFTFGLRQADGDWKFFAQVTKGCMAAVNRVSDDLAILGYVDFATL
jgi:hypothetical protein